MKTVNLVGQNKVWHQPEAARNMQLWAFPVIADHRKKSFGQCAGASMTHPRLGTP